MEGLTSLLTFTYFINASQRTYTAAIGAIEHFAFTWSWILKFGRRIATTGFYLIHLFFLYREPEFNGRYLLLLISDIKVPSYRFSNQRHRILQTQRNSISVITVLIFYFYFDHVPI